MVHGRLCSGCVWHGWTDWLLQCKPKKCRQECKRNCPVVRTGQWIVSAARWTGAVGACSAPLRVGGPPWQCATHGRVLDCCPDGLSRHTTPIPAPPGKMCIEVDPTSKISYISEEVCLVNRRCIVRPWGHGACGHGSALTGGVLRAQCSVPRPDVHRLRYLCEEVSVRCDFHHQPPSGEALCGADGGVGARHGVGGGRFCPVVCDKFLVVKIA